MIIQQPKYEIDDTVFWIIQTKPEQFVVHEGIITWVQIRITKDGQSNIYGSKEINPNVIGELKYSSHLEYHLYASHKEANRAILDAIWESKNRMDKLRRFCP